MRFIITPSHGYLEVSKAFGLPFKSNYSYECEDKVYLEEDCDLSSFIKYAEKNDIVLLSMIKGALNKPIHVENTPKLSWLIH